ncbi:hypothetical protein [Roseomonas fluvialis]|uniref:Secreted protein n=1 Tax=Roseomonas fluvialis TaxID=1750527 RepID=A0ABM7XX90_9PROT|nr:hypothetical protein [Roseomonas fluvialis]BDG70087.1 hypothetical protein Rmf_00160 [Roseomonas fluvialis]
MPSFRRLTILVGLAASLVPAPAMADSQSSDSSSNCSNGRCTRVDRMVIEDRHGRRGWVREQTWRERDGRGPRGWGQGGPQRLPDWRLRRSRDDDDDD